MKEKEILNKLEEILKENDWIPNKHKEKITENTEFTKELGMDSLEAYEFSYAVEEKFGIRVPDEKIIEFKIIGDYIEHIQNYNSENQ